MRAKIYRFASLALLGALGFYLLGSPSDSDTPFSAVNKIGVYLVFLAWIGCVEDWGRFFLSLLGKAYLGWAFALGTGFAFCSLLVWPLSSLGWLQFKYAGPLLGIFLLSPLLVKRKNIFPIRPFKFSWPLQILVVLLFFCLFLTSFQLQSFWDPLWYNLPATRAWAEAGSVYFSNNSVVFFHCGAWDYLYIWSHIFLGAPNGRGLIAAQYFCQWLHLGALIVSIFALDRILRHFCRDRGWRWLAIFSSVTAPPIFFTSLLAKNDWGATMWFLMGMALIFSKSQRSKKIIMASGLFWGLSLGAKWTIAFTLLPFLFYWFYQHKNFKSILPKITGILFGLAPILFRNWSGTGNPFYPLFASYFPSPLPNSWIQSFEGIANKGSFSIFDLIREFLIVSPFFILSLALIPWIKRNKQIVSFFLMLCISFLFLAIAGGKNVLLRWWGPGLVLASSCFFLVAAQFLRERITWSIWIKNLQVSFLVVLLLLAPLPWKTSFARLWKVDAALQIRMHPSGASLAWLRMNRPNEKIAVLRDTRLYYLNPVREVRVWDSYALSEKISHAPNAEAFLRTMIAEGYTLLLDNAESIDLYQDDNIVREVEVEISQHPRATLFQEPTARVIHIPTLLNEMNANLINRHL